MDGAVVVQILTNADVARSCTASRAVRVMRQAIAAHADGRLAAPPRAYTQLETGPMVYTAGALSRRVHGVRIYDYAGSEQAVAVWNSETGRLVALAVGDELGRRRTGAIGAVAIDALAGPDAARSKPVVAIWPGRRSGRRPRSALAAGTAGRRLAPGAFAARCRTTCWSRR
jgi:ornithine cyclodeaminase/alanine dehydrogenase-like protein (mu-crystallin family)